MFYIKIKVFGIFNDYFKEEIIIEFSDKINVNDLKKIIKEQYFVNNLSFLNKVLSRSLFSYNNIILSDNHYLNSGDIVYLLPPFSGG